MVHGDLAVDSNFKVDISRVMDGDYQLVVADGGTISGFSAVDLANLAANSTAISLNGKTVKGNNRVDYTGGLRTELRNDNEIWLMVDSTSDGNVITQWVGGASGNTWDMTAENFNATSGPAGFSGNNQFLDGDIVVFDYGSIDEANRTVNVTTDNRYVGDHATVPNVAVAEVQITGGSESDQIVWNGGSIFAYNSALLSTLDAGSAQNNNQAPSGQLVKEGEGTLVINNANEFYGGIVLGGNGSTGGTVILNNEKGFGTYDTSSGFVDKGLVFVEDDTILDVSGLNGGKGGTINNRFIVNPGKSLTFEFGDTNLNISGNNALYSGGTVEHSGRGGGMYVSDEGGITYSGTGALTFNRNQAQYGGGIYSQLGYTFQAPTTVTANYASKQGGGVYAEKHFEMVSGSNITNNASQEAGGGFYAGNKGSLAGGERNDLTLHGNTVVSGNVTGAAVGGGGYVDGGRILNIETETDGDNAGGDVWFQDNYANVGFDADDPVNGPRNMKNATRSAVHLSATDSDGDTTATGAVMNISGPYNTYFYDPISGDAGTTVAITGVQANATNSTNLPASQYGTVIMRGDSVFYGSTTVAGNATFRLESFSEADGTLVQAVYGRKVNGSGGPTNTFTQNSETRITGSGTVMADTVLLSGILDLDTGTFTKPTTKDGSGGISAADAQTQGNLAIDGDVTVNDSAVWNLNLTNQGGIDPRSDLVTVAGNTTFTGTTSGSKLLLNIDQLVHGRYTIMASSGGFNGSYNTNRQLSDAIVNYRQADGTIINLAAPPAGNDAILGRLRVTSYVDPDTNTSLYLDVAGRNRYITASSGGTWAFNPDWEYDTAYNPTGTGSVNVNWSNLDSGPATNVYLDGDMVRLTGGTYALPGTVNPVDLFVSGTGNVTFTGAGSIKTYDLTASTLANGPNDTTILPENATSGTNDYGIPEYTGKLYKQDGTTLTFLNTGGNRFAQGVEIGTATVDGGVIAFNNGRQLTVGTGQFISFVGNGTLHSTASTTLASQITVATGKTGTFDVDPGTTLTLNQLVTGAGGIEKIGSGILNVTGANNFAGGTTLSEGTLVAGNNKAFSTYAAAGGIDGQITVTDPGQKIFQTPSGRVLQNRFVVDSTAGNGLLLNIASGTILTVENVTATGLNGGAFSIEAGADQLAFSSTSGSLNLSGNSAANGGGIYTAATGALNFTNPLFLTGNTASGDGGGIWSASEVVINNNTSITGNKAGGSGGAIYAPTVTVNATANTITLSGNSAGTSGGALYVNGGALNLNATGGDITFNDNKAATGSGAYIAAGGSVNVNAAANRVVHFNNNTLASNLTTDQTLTKTGDGTLSFTGAGQNNQFRGTTNVTDGTFRVTDSNTYGYAGSAGTMTVADGARLTGGGTIELGGGSLNVQGTISADSLQDPAFNGENIGTLNVNGNVNLTGSATPSLVVDLEPSTTGFNPQVVNAADFLNVTGGLAVTGANQVVVDLQNYGTGLYHLIATTTGLNTGTFSSVNGIGNTTGAFTATVNNRGLTSRHNIAFLRGGETYNGTAIPGTTNDLYLAAQVNNLVTNWTGANGSVWANTNEANNNWLSADGSGEEYFYNGDTVQFGDLASAQNITVQGTVSVTGMNITGSTNYTFGGSGNIVTQSTWEGTLLPYAPGAAPETLVKTGGGTLAFRNTGTNNFAGGIDLNGGIIGFTGQNQLGGTDIRFGGDGTLRADANTALTNNIIVQENKAGTINTQGNALALNGPQTVGAGANLTYAGAGNGLLLVNGDVSGPGTVTQASGTSQIGLSNTFAGNTVVNGGAFRVATSQTHGGGGNFTVNAGGTVAGGGTINAGQINIAGTISADDATLTQGNRTVGAYNTATLTTNGATTLKSDFRMDYDIRNGATPSTDLLRVTNGDLTINSGVINLRSNSGISGNYLIMLADANRPIVIGDPSGDPNALLTAQINGNSLASSTTVRAQYSFDLRDENDSPGNYALWLDITHNSLDMVWQTSGRENDVWTADGGGANWLSLQGGSPAQEKDRYFQNGDYVHFLTSSGSSGIRIDGDVLVSGMEVDSGGDYTFTGDGAITATTTDGSIEGAYLTATPTLVPDGKLNKYGSGTLTFQNTGGNRFENGIDIHSGTIAFNQANQLTVGPTVGADIHFIGNGTLRADADGMTLGTDMLVDAGVTATIDTQTNNLTLNNVIDGDGSLSKNGTGTLTLTGAANTYDGATAVNSGRLIADGVAQLGESRANRTITTGSGAVLEVVSSADETLNQLVSGQGSLVKSGTGNLTVTNAGNSYAGTTTIQAATLTATSIGAINGTNKAEVAMAGGSRLEMNLDSPAKSGSLNKKLTGQGALLFTGNATLTLTNADSTYTGGTTIQGVGGNAHLIATTTKAVGTGAIAITGADDIFEANIAADGSLNQVISGNGELIKNGAGTLTLGGANTFANGTVWNGGDITISNTRGLSATTGAGKAGFVEVNTSGTLTSTVYDATIQNRFDVSSGNQLTFAPNSSLTISGNNVAGVNGGAIELQAGASFVAGQPVYVTGNSTDGSGGGIYAPDAHLTVGGTGTGENTVMDLTGNTAGGDGGGAYVASVTVNSRPGTTVIGGNTATGGRGGAFYLAGGPSAGAPAVSTIDTSNGIITFDGNNDSTNTNNAIHMARNNTLNIKGASAVYMRDNISSDASGRNGNRIVVDLPDSRDLAGAFNLYGQSDYYGDTDVAGGVMMLRDVDTRFGQQAADGNIFNLYNGAVLAGYGTIAASDINLAGVISAGNYNTNRRPGQPIDIEALKFEGAVTMGTLPGLGTFDGAATRAGIGQVLLDIDLDNNADPRLSADRMLITGGLEMTGISRSDLSTFVAGEHLIITTTEEVTLNGAAAAPGTVNITDRFDTTIAGNDIVTNRHNVEYEIREGAGAGREIWLTAKINSEYLLWSAANATDPEDAANPSFNGIDGFKNQWINSPAFDWVDGETDEPTRFESGDLVAFDSRADAGNTVYRQNIEINTTPDNDDEMPRVAYSGARAPARVGDMYVTGGGTFRFTGQGIRSTARPAGDPNGEALGQLYVDGYSQVIFANGNDSAVVARGNEGNNFDSGIELNSGVVAFDHVNQLGTDKTVGGSTVTTGVIISGNNSYGGLTANADNMVLGIPIDIRQETGFLLINTAGLDIDGSPTGAYTLTLKHSENDTADGNNGIYGAGTLVKTGEGVLVLAQENYYKGGTVIEGGTVSVSNDNQLGDAAGWVLLDHGNLRATDNITSNRNIYIAQHAPVAPTAAQPAPSSIEVATGKTFSVAGVVADEPDHSGDPAVGPDDLVKIGDGTLVLANAKNTYAGDTNVQAGRVVGNGVGAYGENADTKAIDTVNNNGVRSTAEVQIASGATETLNQRLTGGGNFVKSGAGRLNLVETASAFQGHIDAAEGELHLAPTTNFSAADSFSVRNGATLSGTGTLGLNSATANGGTGVIMSGGTLKIGGVVADDPNVNPTSTPLTITGNANGNSQFVFASGSIFDVTLTQYPNADDSLPMNPVSDRVDVTNANVVIENGATLNVDIDYWSNNLAPNDFGEDTSDRFTIIDATNGSVDNPGAQFDLGAIYLPRGVELMQGWNGSLYQLWFSGNPTMFCPFVPLTHNQREICTELGHLGDNRDPNPDIVQLLRVVSQRDFDDHTLTQIYDQLHGDLRANALAMALKKPWRHPFARLGGTPFAVLAGRTTSDEAFASYADPNYYQEFWAEGYGRYSTIRTDGNSFRNRIERVGGAFGYDRQLSLNSVMGAVFNYSNPRLKQATGKVSMDDYEIGLYNLTRFGGFDLKAYAGYAYQRYDITRNVYIPTGGRYDAVYDHFNNKVNGHALSASLELIRPFQTTDRLVLSPLVAMDYEQAWMKGYTEHGGITALRYEKADYLKLEARVGANIDARITDRLTLNGRVHYARQLNSDKPKSRQHFAGTSTNTPGMNIWGVRRGKDTLNIGVGLEYAINQEKTRAVYLNYDADVSRRETTHTGNVGFVWSW